MSKFVNIRVPEGYMVDPTLAVLIDTLALRHPTLTFSTKGFDQDAMHYYSNGYVMLKQPRPAGATDATRYMDRLQVHAGDEHIGVVALGTKIPRGGGPTEAVYVLKNWRLAKRDTRTGDVLKTTKLNVAIREFKKYFMPRAMDEAYNVDKDLITHALNAAYSTLKRAIQHGNHMPNNTDIQRYLYLTLNGMEPKEGLTKLMADAFTSDKYKESMANFMLAKHMERFSLAPVVEYQGAYLYTGSGGELQHVSYEDLPEDVQTNMAILQLCKDNEVVRDVGFRYKDGKYAVVHHIKPE